MEQKELKIVPPEGYEIDNENSTFECIKFKKVKNGLTIEKVHNALEEEGIWHHVVYVCEKSGSLCLDRGLSIDCADARLAKIVAYAALSDIAEYYNKGWKPIWKNRALSNAKFSIALTDGKFYGTKRSVLMNDGTIYFNSEKDAQAVIDNPNFREILNTLYK